MQIKITNFNKKNNLTNFKGNNPYTPIDKNNCSRIGIYNAFKKFQSPYNNINNRLTITELLQFTKENNIKNSHAIIYLVGKSINDIPEFRTRLLDNGEIVEYKQVDPIFSVAVGEGKPFSAGSVQYDNNPKIYLEKLAKKIEELKNGKGGVINQNLFKDKDNFFTSCAPNLDFVSITAANINNKDSKPIITWGKYVPEEKYQIVDGKLNIIEEIKMSIALRIHHGFADGDHVAKFFNTLQESFNNPKKIFGEILTSLPK